MNARKDPSPLMCRACGAEGDCRAMLEHDCSPPANEAERRRSVLAMALPLESRLYSEMQRAERRGARDERELIVRWLLEQLDPLDERGRALVREKLAQVLGGDHRAGRADG